MIIPTVLKKLKSLHNLKKKSAHLFKVIMKLRVNLSKRNQLFYSSLSKMISKGIKIDKKMRRKQLLLMLNNPILKMINNEYHFLPLSIYLRI